MRKRILSTLAIFPLVLPPLAWPAGSAEKSTSEIVSLAKPAVVLVETQDVNGSPVAQGSGFVVDASGVIVTNFHVIRGAHAVQVKFESGEVYDSVGVIDFDTRRDLAVIKIKAVNLPVVRLGDPSSPKQGQRVIAIGNPLGLEHTVSDGLISAFRTFGGTRYLQISVPISPGSSGGPLFDMNGDVVGITTAAVIAEGAQGLNLAVSSDYIQPMLGKEPKTTFGQIARDYPPERENEASSALSAGSGEQFWVLHDHGDEFENYCMGILTAKEPSLSYKSTNSAHSFEIPLEAIAEVKKNALYGADLDAFHIKMKTKSNYNFAVINENGDALSSDPLIFAIQKALLRGKEK